MRFVRVNGMWTACVGDEQVIAGTYKTIWGAKRALRKNREQAIITTAIICTARAFKLHEYKAMMDKLYNQSKGGVKNEI